MAVRGGVDRAAANACLTDYHTAPIPEKLRARARLPGDDDPPAARAVGFSSESRDLRWVSRVQLADAAAVGTIFNIITRYADALGFTIPTDAEFNKAAGILLKRGDR